MQQKEKKKPHMIATLLPWFKSKRLLAKFNSNHFKGGGDVSQGGAKRTASSILWLKRPDKRLPTQLFEPRNPDKSIRQHHQEEKNNGNN